MKKVILVLAIILLPQLVKAEEYEWVEDELTGENVVMENRYRFYFENRYGEYVKVGQASSFQYEDKNDIKYGNYSDWTTTCPVKEGYDIEYGTEYNWQEIKPAHYITIVNTGDETINIKEIRTFNIDTEIDYYNCSCSNCTGFNEIRSGGSLNIRLAMSVYVKNIGLYLEVNDNTNFNIIYSANYTIDTDSAVASVKGNSTQKEYRYNKDDYTIFNNYTQTYISYQKDEDEFTKIISTKDVCRYKEIMTYRYNIEKIYYDDNYYKSNSELFDLEISDRELFVKDLTDYKTYYRYMSEEEIKERERLRNNQTLEIVKTSTTKPKYIVLIPIVILGLIICKKCRLKKR